jgi:DNA-binding winged helix-turn-helix (wHTH) protein/tetratricopeptide (TPR) repeat protein
MRLETQPARVLEMLIEAKGGLVARQELITKLWPGEIEGNFDRRLDKAVAKLRASLDDDPVLPRYIETLKGRGYRFLIETAIEQSDAPQVSAQGQLTISAPAPPRQRIIHRLLTPGWITAAAFLVAAVSLLGWRMRSRLSVPAHSRPAVLILGFHDSSMSVENAWISHSIEEWLSTDLGAGGELQILRRGDSPELRWQTSGSGCGSMPLNVIETARRAFNADQVVYGDYTAPENGVSGEQWRLEVCLANTQGGGTPKSMTVAGSQGDIAQLVTNAGELLRSRLGLEQLSNESLGYLRATLPVSQTAARLYAEGALSMEHFEPKEASILLTEAAQIEPQHAPTHAALSTAWAALGYQQRSEQEALLARDMAKNLSPRQKLEYEGLVEESKHEWTAAVDTYGKLLQLYPDSIDHGLKLANAQTNASQAQIALDTLRTLRGRNPAALTDPRVDLAEASADSALSDFRGQLAASTQAEIRAEEQGSELMVANARMEQGDADDKLDNWGEALRLWHSAQESYTSIGDFGGIADALNHQGVMAWNRGDSATAIKLFTESMNLSKAAGNQAGTAYALSRLGEVQLSMLRGSARNVRGALKMYSEAESIFQATGNVAEEGNLQSLYGDEAIRSSQYEEARAFYLKGMALSQAAGDKSRIANRLLDLGIVSEFEGKNQDAEKYFRQSSQAYQNLGQQDRTAIVGERLGKTLLREGRIDEAAPMLEDSLSRLRAIGRAYQVLEVRNDLVALEMVRNPARAVALAHENLAWSKSQGPAGYAGDPCTLAELAEAEVTQGKLIEAQQAIHAVFAQGERSLNAEFLPQLLLSRGYVSMTAHDYRRANADFQRSKNLAHALGQVYQEMEACLALAEMHMLQNGKAALPELDRLKQDASKRDYGIIPIKIATFLRSDRRS